MSISLTFSSPWPKDRHRVPVWTQSEAAECAWVCLAMVARAAGSGMDLSHWRQQFATSLRGANLAQVMRMADAIHLQSRALRVDLEELQSVQLPCILHWDMQHYVVAVEWRRGRLRIHDPAQGQLWLSLSELSSHFTGVVLELWPGPRWVPEAPQAGVTWRQVLGPHQGLISSLAYTAGLGLLLQTLALIAPLQMQWLVDEILVSGDAQLLGSLGLGFALLVLLQVALQSLRAWMSMHLLARFHFQWTGRVLAQVMNLPLEFFHKRAVGDIVARFGSLSALQRAIGAQAVEAVIDGVWVLLTGLALLALAPAMGAVVLGVAAVTALSRYLLRPMLMRTQSDCVRRQALQSGHLIETLQGIQSLKGASREALRHAQHLNLLAATCRAEFRLGMQKLGLQSWSYLCSGLERVALVCWGGAWALQGHWTMGAMLAFLSYREQFAARFQALLDQWMEWKLLGVHLGRAGELVTQAPEPEPATAPIHALSLRQRPLGLNLNNIHFAWSPLEAPVIQGLSLEVQPGECLAIAGVSGQGKSTLLKIILGLLHPQTGERILDGHSFAQLGPQRWREFMAAVLQDDRLFQGTLMDNLTLFDPQPDVEHARACLAMVALDQDLRAMPTGEFTQVGEGGMGLSAGQRQRLLLARALYQKPGILVLDEATSHLDIETEKRVNLALSRLPMTRIMVAHRPQALAMADRVLCLVAGRLQAAD